MVSKFRFKLLGKWSNIELHRDILVSTCKEVVVLVVVGCNIEVSK